MSVVIHQRPRLKNYFTRVQNWAETSNSRIIMPALKIPGAEVFRVSVFRQGVAKDDRFLIAQEFTDEIMWLFGFELEW